MKNEIALYIHCAPIAFTNVSIVYCIISLQHLKEEKRDKQKDSKNTLNTFLYSTTLY